MGIEYYGEDQALPNEAYWFLVVIRNTWGTTVTAWCAVMWYKEDYLGELTFQEMLLLEQATIEPEATWGRYKSFTMPDDVQRVLVVAYFGNAPYGKIYDYIRKEVYKGIPIPELSVGTMSSEISAALEGVAGVKFDLSTEIADIPMPDLPALLGEIKLPVVEDIVPPVSELSAATLVDLASGKLEELKERLGEAGLLPDSRLDFAFSKLSSPDETTWQKTEFPNEFIEPPVVIPTVEVREGWFDSAEFPSPEVAVEEKTISDYQALLTEMGLQAPQVADFKLPSDEEIKAKLDRELGKLAFDPQVGTKQLMDEVKKQATDRLKEALGSWKVGWFSLNGIRDKIIVGLVVCILIVVAITSPATFLLFLGLLTVIGALTAATIKLIYSAVKQVLNVQNQLARANAAQLKAVHDYTRNMGAYLGLYSYRLFDGSLGVMNAFARIHSRQAQAAFNSAVPLLYNMSDLPAMKLPVTTVRNVTGSSCEILVPKGATVHVFVIGMVKTGGFVDRTVAKEPGILEELKRKLFPGG